MFGSLENVKTKSELKCSSLNTKGTLNLILKPPATCNIMQGLLLSLAKASKHKELAYLKLRECVHAFQRKLSQHMRAKINYFIYLLLL